MTRLFPLFCLVLVACGGNDPRYLIEAGLPVSTEITQVRAGTVEMRDVSLPAYAEDSKILLEGANGALVPVADAIWADDPGRAMTLLLAEQVDRSSSATVAAEPWPLESDPHAAIEVRVSEMVARSDGRFDLRGQYAISSYRRVVRERIERFDISVPLDDATPAGIARAAGVAMSQLAGEIIAELAR